jgi:hypothetical protein
VKSVEKRILIIGRGAAVLWQMEGREEGSL